MALTWRRWVAVFVLACAAAVVWLAPPRPIQPTNAGSRYASNFGSRYGWPDAAERLEAANLRLRLLEIRDSAMGPGVVAAARPGLTILTDPAIPDSISRSVGASLDAAWARYDAGTRFPVLVAIVADTSKYNDGLPMLHASPAEGYTFPPDSATAACRVLVRVTFPLQGAGAPETRGLRNRLIRALTLHSTDRATLGPCALYATFGRPGRHVVEWLASAGWEPVQDVDWSQPSPTVLTDLSWQFGVYEDLATSVAGGSAQSWWIRSFLSNDAIACVGGESARCVTGIEAGEPAGKDARAWRDQVIDARSYGVYRGWYFGWGNHFGPAETWLVSDMVRELGRERFAEFWTSPADVSSAFAQAAGTPLGAWAQQWARRQYGRDDLGPVVPARTWWAGLLALVAGLGVALALARERQVA
ncbi:MAG: hypothetical protein KGL38_00020 [Gemmatimonadota bacterium]|nr:hypothetical protein [Gemmatimonadota bacterium]MDE3126354.1 hypothetical protein [Gemmatimonadota bacterium]MDE3173914.1 hypothetical protein [Gemmatimonadota bacterium]MDE3214749.1 hypothetical protein [Gemmatimonadota bacterium]